VTSDFSGEDLDRLGNGVRLIALRALGDPDAARDAAQETMSRVLDALRADRLRDRDKLRAFVRGVARNVIVDMQRARARHAPLSDQLPDRALHDPLEGMVLRDEAAHMRRALAELTDDDRELLRLAFVDGLTPAEVGARLSEPAERIRKRKSRALQRLREHFFALAARARHESFARATLEQRHDEVVRAQRGES